ncbi:hypothetical protein F2Q68_00043760 [Brassica cretica]|uniref:Uncharacterized protein n=1 Tax=Brassica cretica TaxID=69181 RepID=A0A8S9LKG0_BRACR|nr:hypothetical protein F2Q68_00043760 [Brassica cretica]
MPLEPRASWFSPKCIEAQQLTGHLRVKHCFVAGRESGFYIFPLSRSVGKKWTLEVLLIAIIIKLFYFFMHRDCLMLELGLHSCSAMNSVSGLRFSFSYLAGQLPCFSPLLPFPPFQPAIRTEDGFLELAHPRGITTLCPGHCSTCAAHGIRGVKCHSNPELAGSPRNALRRNS